MEDEMICEILFIRHGVSIYKEYYCNEKKFDLIPKGIKQIEKTAEKIEEMIDKKLAVLIVSSPRIRTTNSANIIKKYFESKEVKIVSKKIFLRRSFEAIRFKGNSEEASSRLKEFYKEWIMGYKDPLLESLEDFMSRIKKKTKFYVRIIRKHKNNLPKQIVLVSHGEIMDGFLLGFHFLNEYKRENTIKNGEIVKIQVFSKKICINYRNKVYTLNS